MGGGFQSDGGQSSQSQSQLSVQEAMPSSGPEDKRDTGSAGFVSGSSSVESQSLFSSEGKKGSIQSYFQPTLLETGGLGSSPGEKLSIKGSGNSKIRTGIKTESDKKADQVRPCISF